MEMIMKFRSINLGLSLLLLVSLLNCSSDSVQSNPIQTIPPTDYTFVQYDVASGNPGLIPLPNDLGLRNPFTGQLALPSLGDPAVDGLISQVNTLFGFSTLAPIRIPFDGGLIPESVTNQTLILVDLVDAQAALQGADVNPQRLMRFEVREEFSGQSSVVLGFPLQPLKPGRPHLVIVTPGVTGSPSGLPVESQAVTILLKRSTPLSGDFAALEPLRQVYESTLWPLAESITGLDRLFIPFTYTFTTQPLFNTMGELYKRAQTESPTLDVEVANVGAERIDDFFNLLGLGGLPHQAIGALYVGTFNAPNYISHPITGSFQGEGPNLNEISREDIRFLLTLPPGPGPFPVVIFQHGITRSKEDMFAIANTANSVGAAVIAIDLVLHGERTKGIDAQNNATGAPGPDGIPDPSGANFINLVNLLVSRDNVRQSVADLFLLTRLITSGAGDVNGDGFPELAPFGLTFVGQSLGSIVGTSFVTMDPAVSIAGINVPGARIPYLLQNSATFGPRINAGLSSFGLTPGSALYDLYFMFGQAVFDDADPANYAPHTLSGDLGGGGPNAILLQEMIGDAVIPNSATRDLALAMNLPQVDAVEAVDGLAQVSAPHVGSGMFQFSFGDHGALLDPSNGNPTVAVQTQLLNFLGSALITGQPTIINPFSPPPSKAEPLEVRAGNGLDGTIDPTMLNFFPQR